MKTPHLYELSDSIRSLSNMIESGEMTEDDLRDTLEALDMEFSDKVKSVLHVFREFAALERAAKDEKQRLQKVEAGAKSKQQWLKEYLKAQLQKANKRSVKSEAGTVSLRTGSAYVKIEDIDLVPDKFVTVSIVQDADKNAIKQAIEAGEDVPGAAIEVTDETVQIR